LRRAGARRLTVCRRAAGLRRAASGERLVHGQSRLIFAGFGPIRPAKSSTGRRRDMAGDKNAFVWDDPFLLEGQLSEDERMIRDAAAAFAADKLAPRVEQAYLEEKTDPAIFREMGDAGLLG